MPLTLEQIEGRLIALERHQAAATRRLGIDTRIPLLATGFDIEDAVFPPAARVFNSGAITTNNGSIKLLGFNSERFDTDSMHSLTTNTARFTINTAGKYLISANTEWVSSPTNGLIRIRLNGATLIAVQRLLGSDYRVMSITTVYDLVLTDYVEVQVLQDSGGDLDINATGNYSPEFMITWIAPP